MPWPPEAEMRQLVGRAEALGWDEAMFEFMRTRVSAGGGGVEDGRVADWRFLLPRTGRDAALVLGCGLGTVPAALCDMFATVHVVDTSAERVRLLELRASEHGIANLVPTRVARGGALPFAAEGFDLVVARSSDWEFRAAGADGRGAFRAVAQDVHRVLKEGGGAYLGVPNRLSYERLLRPWTPRDGFACSQRGYRRILAQAGFAEIRFYAPLPGHEGIPLFYVPVDDGALLEYFFECVFPLFDAVSPEVKRLYAVEYRLAKLAVRLGGWLGLRPLARHLVRGFGIIATRGPRRAPSPG